MSAIGGIYRLDGERVGRRQLAALARALEARGPDGGGEVLRGAVGMAHRAFRTTPASHQERQPVVEPGAWMLAWDGRLDNGEELARSLQLDPHAPRTDPDVVLAVFGRWGAQGVAKLVGDFALAAWDERSRDLWLARDPFGARPLFFHVGDGVATWTSDLRPLLDVLGFRPEIDEDYIAGFLAAEVDVARSPFVGIHAVPPGHLVKISQQGVSRTRFWSPVPRTEIRYKTDAEYEEHFRHVFRESVRCRLRASGPVWSELSGGFDSSSIVVVADDLLKAGSTSTRVDTVSYVFDQSPMSNELSYLGGVEDQRGRTGYHILESECPILAPLDPDIPIGGPSYLLCFAKRHRRLCDAMREAGARVLLCGHGGDNVLWSQPDACYELADHLAAGRLLTLHARTLAWSRALSRPYLRVFANGALAPNVPSSLRHRVEWGPPKSDLVNPSLLEKRWRASSLEIARNGLRPSSKEQVRLLGIATSISAACYYHELGGIEVTYPFLDRRVIEFLLALPFDQIVRPGTNRSLHRRAFGASLPDSVRRRRGKRGLDEAFYRGLSRDADAWRSVFDHPLVCERGWVNRDTVRREFDRALRGQSSQLYVLMKIIALEMWMRQLSSRDLTRRPHAMGYAAAGWRPVQQPAGGS